MAGFVMASEETPGEQILETLDLFLSFFLSVNESMNQVFLERLTRRKKLVLIKILFPSTRKGKGKENGT